LTNSPFENTIQQAYPQLSRSEVRRLPSAVSRTVLPTE